MPSLFDNIEADLLTAKPVFKKISPGISALFGGHYARMYKASYRAYKLYKHVFFGNRVGQSIGIEIAATINGHLTRPIATQVAKAHLMMPAKTFRIKRHHSGMRGHFWVTNPGPQEMVIVFHDANRAGPHIDVHIGRMSFVYRVKDHTYKQLKFDKEGYLTENSRNILLGHLKDEIANNSRVPQNLDHSKTNARETFVGGSRDDKGYGAGLSRQVISISRVEILKAYRDGPIEMYAPAINSANVLYLYRLYKGDGNRAPICIWGTKTKSHPSFDDRLHLKLVDPADIDKISDKVDPKTFTAKYDGSSCYFVITPKGTTIWSPRQSKRDGMQIQYTGKIRGAYKTTSGKTVVGMGEVLFKRHGDKFYLPQSVGSGILNSHDILPPDIEAEIRIYRIDTIGNQSYYGEDFWQNRQRQKLVSELNPRVFKVVELMTPQRAKAKGFEGVVAVPQGGSVVSGFKIKWWQDPNDWVIDSVDFKPGDKGGIAGVVYATSLDSGKKFKLGPSQVGDRNLVVDMMNRANEYVGAVMKVQSRHGHEGRAAYVLSLHDDKGIAVIK